MKYFIIFCIFTALFTFGAFYDAYLFDTCNDSFIKEFIAVVSLIIGFIGCCVSFPFTCHEYMMLRI